MLFLLAIIAYYTGRVVCKIEANNKDTSSYGVFTTFFGKPTASNSITASELNKLAAPIFINCTAEEKPDRTPTRTPILKPEATYPNIRCRTPESTQALKHTFITLITTLLFE